jgi:hypothetical protein
MVGSGPKCPFDCSASFPALSGSILATPGVASKLCDFGDPGGPRGLGAEVLTSTFKSFEGSVVVFEDDPQPPAIRA